MPLAFLRRVISAPGSRAFATWATAFAEAIIRAGGGNRNMQHSSHSSRHSQLHSHAAHSKCCNRGPRMHHSLAPMEPMIRQLPLHSFTSFVPISFPSSLLSFQCSKIHVGLNLVIHSTSRHSQMSALDVPIQNLKRFSERG